MTSGRKVNGVESLVKLVKEDINNRGLGPGDRYLYAKDVANLFSVNQMMAHRAMKELAGDGVLVRRARRGTFIGPKFNNNLKDNGNILKSVHIMMAIDYRLNADISDEVFLEGVNLASPGTAVQIHYVPNNDPLGYTKHIVNQIELGGAREGLIFIRSTEQVQRYIQEKDLNAAIFGSVYPGIKNIPWLDVNQSQIGKLMVRYGFEQNCERFLVFMYNQWRRGDNMLFNSIISELGEVGLGMDSLGVHSLPDDRKFMLDDIRLSLSEAKFPIAVLGRSQGIVNTVIEAADSMGLEIGKDIKLVSGAHLQVDSKRKHAYVESECSLKEQVSILVKMIIDKICGKVLESNGYIVQVALKGG